jgi:hypothetical protein
MGRCIGSLYCSLATSAALRRDIENRPSVPRAVVGCTLREFAVPCVGERASTVHHWRNAAVCTASASHRELAQQKLHGWGSRAHFVLVRHIFVSCSTSMKVAWKMKWSSTSLVLARIRERADDAVGWAERRSWLFLAVARVPRPNHRPVSKSGCTRTRRAGSSQDIAPSALHGSVAIFGTF